MEKRFKNLGTWSFISMITIIISQVEHEKDIITPRTGLSNYSAYIFLGCAVF